MMRKFEANKTEKDIMRFWKEKDIYKKAKNLGKGKKPFYFLDGPPYTSGNIHLGTAWNKPLKDMVMRYKRMAGFDVWDRAGYDMHGLPVELKVQKKLKIEHKDDIPKFGVGKFVNECKDLAMSNLKLMNKDFIRLGVWMDFDNPYKSVDNTYVEGTWWLCKKAHENKRLYESEKVMHWCSECSTSLAKHELEYENVTDDSIFVRFPVEGRKKEFLIIWTTTPWTIPYNLGVMVNPELDYVKAKVEDETWIVSKGLAPALIRGVADKEFKIEEEFKGKELEGLRYIHPFCSEFDYASLGSKKIHTVVLSREYVDLSAGSGLVHMAPGCGPEDYEVGRKNGICPFNNLNEFGVFPESMGKFRGWKAKKDDKKFIKELEDRGALIASTPVEHEYAHCWRCKSPVIFKTTKQWFFKVEDLKDEMKELNKKITWVPGWAGSRQFDSWLDNLRDNGITRQRYWGSPVPIWRCKDCNGYDVFGSIKELGKKAKVPDDIHKPWIDKVYYKCECGGRKERIPDILDVWIDAGSASWNCLDFPKSNELFDRYFPADFILEGKDQIRGWFNLLLVASMVSMKKPSFNAVYMHGFVNDALGRKMSKSLGNIISPYEVIDEYGADSFRYYTIGGANPGIDLNYNFDDIKTKHKNLSVLWNLHNFLIDSNVEFKQGMDFSKDYGVEERHILSRLNSTVKKVTKLFDDYLLNEIPLQIEELFLDLSRTYIQLVREKSSIGSDLDKKIVMSTIFKVLLGTLKLFAPVVPFTTEQIYLHLRERFKLKEESIHLCEWPKVENHLIDKGLEHQMAHAKMVIQSILSSRDKAQLGVRWPVKEVLIITKNDSVKKAVEQLKDIIKRQCNVKDVDVRKDFDDVKTSVRADFAKLGPDFGELSPKIIAKLVSESAAAVLAHIEKEGKYPMNIDGKKINLVKEHMIVERDIPEDYVEAEFRHGLVYLYKKLDKDLEAEGFSREMMRRVQALRKKAGLQKSDVINLNIQADAEMVRMLLMHQEQIREKVGAESIEIFEAGKALKNKDEVRIKDFSFVVSFEKK